MEKILYCRNEGPYCGCWEECWVLITPEATEDEVQRALMLASYDLTERVYELCADENEYDMFDDEDAYLERDSDIAAECVCMPDDFTESNISLVELYSYSLSEHWNENHTVCYFLM